MTPIPHSIRWRRLLLLAGCALLLLAGAGRSAAQSQPSQLLVRDIAAGPADSRPILLDSSGDKAFFLAETTPDGWELWATDATAAGTILLTAMTPDPEFPRIWIGGSAAFEGGLAFLRSTEAGFELWRSDGTPAGTRSIVAVTGQAPEGSALLLGGALHFLSVEQGAQPWEQTHRLWRSDGTAAGTAVIATMPLSEGYSSADVSVVGGELYLVVQTTAYGSRTGAVRYKHFNGAGFAELAVCHWGGYPLCAPSGAWRDSFVVTADNPARFQFNRGAVMSTLDLGSRGLRRIADFAGTDQYLLFGAETDDDRYQIWRTDGTPAGTRALVTMGPRAGATLGGFTPANGLIYFFFEDSNGTDELWQSDGTAAGTRRVSGANLSFMIGIQATAAGLIFKGEDPDHGVELWHIPAANARPVLLHDVEPGPASSVTFSTYVMSFRGGLLWSAKDAAAGEELRFLTGGFAPYLGLAWGGGPSGGVATAPVALGNRGVSPGGPLTLDLTLPGGVSLASHTLDTPPTVNGNTLRWTIASLPATSERIVRFGFRLPEAPLGSGFTATLSLEPGGASVPVRLEIARQHYLPGLSLAAQPGASGR